MNNSSPDPLLTSKQRHVVSLIKKTKEVLISPQKLFDLQTKKKDRLTKKAINQHLLNLTKMQLLIRIKHGNYIQASQLKHISALQKVTIKKEALPSYLSEEDIEKLIEWKTNNITQTNEKIGLLQIALNKLKSQKSALFYVKKKLC